MQRLLYQKLLDWKQDKQHKPLILQGARQVGKTWLMKEFGRKEYRNYIYVNFDKDTWAKDLFAQDYNVERILLLLQANTGIKAEPGQTLIILDELQEATRGLGALKYFCEDAPQYHVMAAGSLLGITLHQGTSFPVGKVNMLTLYPMSFDEFLLAMQQDAKVQLLRSKDWQIIAVMHELFMDLLRQYYFVGGMPEAVLSYVTDKDLKKVRTIQKEIIVAYRSDISKHAPTNDIPRINMVMDSIPAQLAKENRKFIYGVLKQGARAKEFEMAIQWLMDAGIVYKINLAKEAVVPLKFYEDFSSFKLFLSDCGLMGCLAETPASLILNGNNILKEYKDAFTEAYVLQQLRNHFDTVYYWSSNDSKCEIDMMVQIEERVLPIEVKAEDNVHAQSLRNFCTCKYPGMKGLRCSTKGYIDQEWMENIPLYVVDSFFTDN